MCMLLNLYSYWASGGCGLGGRLAFEPVYMQGSDIHEQVLRSDDRYSVDSSLHCFHQSQFRVVLNMDFRLQR